jgi:hypothetical protein
MQERWDVIAGTAAFAHRNGSTTLDPALTLELLREFPQEIALVR